MESFSEKAGERDVGITGQAGGSGMACNFGSGIWISHGHLPPCASVLEHPVKVLCLPANNGLVTQTERVRDLDQERKAQQLPSNSQLNTHSQWATGVSLAHEPNLAFLSLFFSHPAAFQESPLLLKIAELTTLAYYQRTKWSRSYVIQQEPRPPYPYHHSLLPAHVH